MPVFEGLDETLGGSNRTGYLTKEQEWSRNARRQIAAFVPTQAFRSTADDSKAIKIPQLGLEFTMRPGPEMLNGTMTIFETVNAPGFGPPVHRHREAEVFRVMEGASEWPS
jgi:mannose-6-phosphate isomerase-like protein (cupin superfamily)